MERMSVTSEVFQSERSRDVRPEQPWNMWPMSVTFEVFQPDRPRDPRDVRAEQPQSM